jgi:phosphonate transport system permease protein
MMVPPDPGSSLPAYLVALGETLSIALLGTTIGALFALPVSLLAARNIIPSAIFRFPVRRFLDSIRGVDTLIWALVWINVVGLGPFAGVLAIAVSDFGAFGKLFSRRSKPPIGSRSKVSGRQAATRCTKSALA